jgi:hypothetical protein
VARAQEQEDGGAAQSVRVRARPRAPGMGAEQIGEVMFDTS